MHIVYSGVCHCAGHRRKIRSADRDPEVCLTNEMIRFHKLSVFEKKKMTEL